MSLIISGVLQFYVKAYNIQQFLLSIFLSVFGGAIVSLIIYISEYIIAKRECLENYYSASCKVLDKFSNLQPIYFVIPKDLELRYTEIIEDKSDLKSLDPKEFFNRVNLEKNSSTLNELINYYKNQNSSEYEKYMQNIKDVMTQYIDISNTSYLDVEDAYGKIDYLFSRKARSKIYHNIHVPQRDMLDKIRYASCHFKLYLKGETTNTIVIIDYILGLQKLIFSYDIKDHEGACYLTVYNSYYSEISKALEIFRASIYNQKPQYDDKERLKNFGCLIYGTAIV
jgi:ribosomal protein S15P/S13E